MSIRETRLKRVGPMVSVTVTVTITVSREEVDPTKDAKRPQLGLRVEGILEGAVRGTVEG
jgi:hypothetical protein